MECKCCKSITKEECLSQIPFTIKLKAQQVRVTYFQAVIVWISIETHQIHCRM